MDKILKALSLSAKNSGASDGTQWWSTDNKTGSNACENPATQKIIATVNNCGLADYQRIAANSHTTFLRWRSVPAPKRGELIRQIGQLLRTKKSELGDLICLESGKTKVEADGEVQEMIDMADFAVGQARMLYGKTLHSERPAHRLYEQWHPLGVVGVITAFNFPVAVWAWNAFLAAMTGNTVIWKPSPKTPLCAIAVQHICNQVMRDYDFPGIFSLFITDDHHLMNTFVEDPRISLISFTGSTNVGRSVAEKISQRLGRCLLELGGNNAIIVDEFANLELAIPEIVFSAVGTAGQRCTSTRRLIIHHSRYQEVINRLKKAYHQIRIGDPLNVKNLMGPLIDQASVNHFAAAIIEIKNAGGKIVYGGHVLEQRGYFVEPTIVEADPRWEIIQRETFAPILYLMPYKTLEEAMLMHNQVPQGLSSAMFTDNLQHAEYFLSACGSDCGIANINTGTAGAEIGGAFGGEKESGHGREAGSDAWKAYMRRQTVTINWGNDYLLAQNIKFGNNGMTCSR